MFAGTEQCGGDREGLGALQSLDRRAGRDPPVKWNIDGVVGGRGPRSRSGVTLAAVR